MKKIIRYLKAHPLLLLLVGLILGWIIFHSPKPRDNQPKEGSLQHNKETLWTCSMHPQIRMHEPGKCPICGMDLIPLGQKHIDTDTAAIQLSQEALQLANVMTTVVSRKQPVKEIRLFGKVQADERLVQSQTAHIPGRIEDLTVNFTGESIRRGQTLATIYSPELSTAQQELLETAKTKNTQPEIYEASREKLRLWKLSENQINAIEASGKIRNDFEVNANTSGVVTAKMVNSGDHVAEGTVLFQIADLSRVWVMFDVYESDLQFLQKGDRLDFSIQALPGTTYSETIEFIDPVIDPVTRVAKIRVEVSNQSGRLKPEMFVTGIVKARLKEYGNMIVIPKSAVLWTGTRSIVYVKKPDTDEPQFQMREITLGPLLGNSYAVVDGIKEGDEIVTQGTFSVDAAAQLEGKPSMMNHSVGTISDN